MPGAGAEESIGCWNCLRKVFGKLPCGVNKASQFKLATSKTRLFLRGLPHRNLVSGGGVYVKGVHLGGGFYEGSQYFFYLRIVLPPV